MATNFEYYKDKILEIIKNGSSLAVEGNKPVSCRGMKCYECDFVGTYGDCNPERLKWLYAEHVEAPKLTKREKAFCEAVQDGWISINNRAVWSDVEPICSEAECGKYFIYPGYHEVFKIPYSLFNVGRFERWTKHKVEDLLKLEVIEEVHHEAD